MNYQDSNKRDGKLDCLKGIAISIVVIGHILEFGVISFGDIFIFNIIWSIQIPLFMIVSGYFAGKGELKNIIKRARTYLIPFVSCFLIKFLVIRRDMDLGADLIKLSWHIEESLWYLYAIFILSTIHILAQYICKKMIRATTSEVKSLICYSVLYGFLLIPWAIIAFVVGTTFLGSKFILYYSLFYWLGYVWRYINDCIKKCESNLQVACGRIVDILCLVALLVYVLIIGRYNLYKAEDNLIGIIPRFVASVCGSFVVIKTVFAVYDEGKWLVSMMRYIGNYTLEIYYFHYLVVVYLGKIQYEIFSAGGMLSIAIDYIALLGISALLTIIINSSPYLNFLILGKTSKNKG